MSVYTENRITNIFEIRIDNVIAEGPATKGIDIGKTAKLFISLSSISSEARVFFF